MRKMKYIIGFLFLFMVIGYATVSVSLSINGNASVVSDLDDFNVYFSDVKVNDKQDLRLVKNDKELVFEVNLKELGETQKITYDVTNASSVFDASLSISCTQGNELLSVTNVFDTSTNLVAKSTRTGNLTLSKIKTNPNETDSRFAITCTIVASPVPRETEGSGSVIAPVQEAAILKSTTRQDTTAFRNSTYKSKIKTITFEDEINVPDNAIESWDIGEAQNGNVMAYVTSNETDSTYYDLYIQSDTQLYANKDMSNWFYNMTYLDSINGLELLDTSMTTNMSYMFQYTGEKSTTFTLDVSGFDTSNVTNMNAMFQNTGNNSTTFTLDVSNFDTSNVTNMSVMFYATGYSNPNFTLDVSNFDTSKVTDMSNMFENFGYNSTNLTLDLSNFDTSNVTNMAAMFRNAGHNSTTFTLDVSNFDTSKVTNMNVMFFMTGYTSEVFTLDVSGFDTSNVTAMNEMFVYTGFNSTRLNTSITIRNPNTAYNNIFSGVAIQTGSQITVNYTSETSSLVDSMIATKWFESNVVKGVQVD